jgi:Holliday junction resolvase RusA-like endonuclease
VNPRSSAGQRRALAVEGSCPPLAEVVRLEVGALLEQLLEGRPRLVVEVPGPPVPKSRTNPYVDEAGRARVRMPAPTRHYEQHVRRLAGLLGPAHGWPSGGWSSPARYVVWAEVTVDDGKVDLDNVLKSLIDGLQGPVMPNDRLVSGIYSHKRVAAPGERPGAVVKVWALGPTGDQSK